MTQVHAELRDMLDDAQVQRIIEDMGIAGEPADQQAELIAMLGENILNRIVVEIAKKLPPEKLGDFEAFYGAEDVQGLRAFLEPYIPNLEEYIQAAVQKEVSIVKEESKKFLSGDGDGA